LRNKFILITTPKVGALVVRHGNWGMGTGVAGAVVRNECASIK